MAQGKIRVATVDIMGASPYGQSGYVDPELKRPKESHNAFEERSWRERCSVVSDDPENPDTRIIIPTMAWKRSLDSAASFLRQRIEGKGQSEYGKHFRAGVQVFTPMILDVRKEDVKSVRVFVPSNGKRGGGTRVWKTFPMVAKEEWGGTLDYLVLDETIPDDVFSFHLQEAGKFIGVGTFRPENGGYWGMYAIKKITWSETTFEDYASEV